MHGSLRTVLASGLIVGFSACPPQSLPNPPPLTQFYFPTGLVHVDACSSLGYVGGYIDGGTGPDGGFVDGGFVDTGFVPTCFTQDGYLFVASANFDKRFDTGAVMAVDLATIGLPPFDAGFAGAPKQILDLKIAPQSTVQIGSFAGEMVGWVRKDSVRLFVPSRSEEHRLYAIDATIPKTASDVPTLGCSATIRTRPPAMSSPGGPLDCTQTGISLVQFEKGETGIPRAPAPIGVAISPGPQPEVWVTAMQQADTPKGSTFDARGFVVHLDAEKVEPVLESYINVGQGATHSIVVGKKHAYATGRIFASNAPANLVRAIDTGSHEVFSTSLESSFTAFEGRGAALSTDEKRLYVLSRSPDTLIVASITDKGVDAPEVRIERTIPVPEGPSLMTVIKRFDVDGRPKSDLVAISCSTAGLVTFYDDEVGDLVGQIAGVGLQPYALAASVQPTGGARLYVTNFTDGRIAVIDVPDLFRPAGAKLVAFLGRSQLCLTRGTNDATACSAGE